MTYRRSPLVSRRRRRCALLASLFALLIMPVSAGAAITKLTAGVGIKLTPGQITSTGKIALALPLGISKPLSTTLVTLHNTGSGDALDLLGGVVGLRAAVSGTGKYGVVARGGDGGAGIEASGGASSGEGVSALGSGVSPGVLGLGGSQGGSGLEGMGQQSGPGVTGIGGLTGDGVDGTAAGTGAFGVSGVSSCSSCRNAKDLSASSAAGHFTSDAGYGLFAFSNADNAGVFENDTSHFYTLYAQADATGGYPFEARTATGKYMYLDPNGNLYVDGNIYAAGTVNPNVTMAMARKTATVASRVAPGGVAPGSTGSVAQTTFDGNVLTGPRGFATVRLPASFDRQNRDPRYQLTAVGSRGWDARLGIWRAERHNEFVIRSSVGRIEVSWQVTATPR